MKRVAMVAALCSFALAAVSTAHAQQKKEMPAMGGEHGTGMSCGQVMKEKSAFPAKESEFLTAVAEFMDLHSKNMMKAKSKEAKQEGQLLAKLAKMHKDLAAQTKKMADQMASGEKLAMPADHPAPDAKEMEAMGKMMGLEKEMSAWLKHDVDMMEKMQKTPSTGGQK